MIVSCSGGSKLKDKDLSKAQTKVFLKEVGGGIIELKYYYEGDKVIRQTAHSEIPYTAYGLSTKEEVEKKVEPIIKQYKGLKGVEHKIVFENDRVIEDIIVDYDDIEYDKVKNIPGINLSGNTKDGVSMAASESMLLSDGFVLLRSEKDKTNETKQETKKDETNTGATQLEETVYVLDSTIKTEMTYYHIGDDVKKQRAKNIIPYAALGVNNEEEARNKLEPVTKSYENVSGVKYVATYENDKLIEDLELDYETLDYDKAKNVKGLLQGTNIQKGSKISLKATVELLKQNGFTEKK